MTAIPTDENTVRTTYTEPTEHRHKWDGGKEIGRTGDWFHPLIVEYRCACGARKTEDV